MSRKSTLKFVPHDWIKVGDPSDPDDVESAPIEPTPAARVTDPTPAERATDSIGRALRHDGWTPARQRTFLAEIAGGQTIARACAIVGLSAPSAYALRDRAAGSAFALGWTAANLIARELLADRLLARAIDGHVERTTRANGDVVERHRYDNSLASRMLARLDRQAEVDGPATQAAARLVAGEFEAYLDLVGRDEGPARAGLFLAARAPGANPAHDLAPVRALARADRFVRVGAALPGEVDTNDLDLAARAGWSAEQWQRAEAAGLLSLAPEPKPAKTVTGHKEDKLVTDAEFEALGECVWWDDAFDCWRTSFAPPADFDGDEDGKYGEEAYERDLTPEEARIVIADHALTTATEREEADAQRDRWFATLAAGLAAGLAKADTDEPEGEEGDPVPPPRQRGRWAGLEGEDRLDRQHDGRDRQHSAGQRFHDAHDGSPAGFMPDPTQVG